MPERMIFDWPGRHNLNVVLPVTVLLAVILHVGVFFVFSIVYPVTESAGPEPAEFFFPLPGSADEARLKQIVPVNDPTLFAPGGGGMREGLPFGTYRPTFDSPDPQPEALPVPADDEAPPVLAGGPVVVPRERESRRTVQRPSTRLVLSSSLGATAMELPAGTVFFADGRTVPDPARFLVAVRADGTVANRFLQVSSGSPDLDREAAKVLGRLEFPPAGREVRWGDVTFVWGGDIRSTAGP
jgi:hypothetical protein